MNESDNIVQQWLEYYRADRASPDSLNQFIQTVPADHPQSVAARLYLVELEQSQSAAAISHAHAENQPSLDQNERHHRQQFAESCRQSARAQLLSVIALLLALASLALTWSQSRQVKSSDFARPQATVSHDLSNIKTEQKPEKKINPTVDAIHGFGSFILGAPTADYASRVKFPSVGIYLHKDPLDSVEAEVVTYLDNEREWATFPVKKTELFFQEGLVCSVNVNLAPQDGFWKAFEIKYGPPTSSHDALRHWEGNDTKVQVYYRPFDYWSVTITSKKVTRLCEERTKLRHQKDREASEQRAREAAKRF